MQKYYSRIQIKNKYYKFIFDLEYRIYKNTVMFIKISKNAWIAFIVYFHLWNLNHIQKGGGCSLCVSFRLHQENFVKTGNLQPKN